MSADTDSRLGSTEVSVSKRWIILANLVSAIMVAVVGGSVTAVLTANPYGPSMVSRIAGALVGDDGLVIDSSFSGTMCGPGASLHVGLRGLTPGEEVRLRAIPIEQNVQSDYRVLFADDEGVVSRQEFGWRYGDGECPRGIPVITVQVQVHRDSVSQSESYWITKDIAIPVL